MGAAAAKAKRARDTVKVFMVIRRNGRVCVCVCVYVCVCVQVAFCGLSGKQAYPLL